MQTVQDLQQTAKANILLVHLALCLTPDPGHGLRPSALELRGLRSEPARIGFHVFESV